MVNLFNAFVGKLSVTVVTSVCTYGTSTWELLYYDLCCYSSGDFDFFMIECVILVQSSNLIS